MLVLDGIDATGNEVESEDDNDDHGDETDENEEIDELDEECENEFSEDDDAD